MKLGSAAIQQLREYTANPKICFRSGGSWYLRGSWLDKRLRALLERAGTLKELQEQGAGIPEGYIQDRLNGNFVRTIHYRIDAGMLE